MFMMELQEFSREKRERTEKTKNNACSWASLSNHLCITLTKYALFNVPGLPKLDLEHSLLLGNQGR